MAKRRRETWAVTPDDLPPEWIIEREPLLAGAAENAVFRFIHHRRRLGKASGDGEASTVAMLGVCFLLCYVGVIVFVVWLLARLVKASGKGKSARDDTVFRYLPRATLDDFLTAPLPKGEFALAIWADSVSARYCWWQRFTAWAIGAPGGMLFFFCAVVHHQLGSGGSLQSASFDRTEMLSFIILGEVLGGILVCASVATLMKLRHLPYSALRGQLGKLRRRRAEIISRINFGEAIWRTIGQIFLFVAGLFLLFMVLGAFGSLLENVSETAWKKIWSVLSEPFTGLFLSLALLVGFAEISGRYAKSKTRQWLTEIERHALWFREYVRLIDHEPSDKAALKRLALRQPGVIEFNRL